MNQDLELTMKNIDRSWLEEDKAELDYGVRANQAERAGLLVLANKFREIQADELHHKLEITRIKDAVRNCRKTPNMGSPDNFITCLQKALGSKQIYRTSDELRRASHGKR
jgi:rubrerythrin